MGLWLKQKSGDLIFIHHKHSFLIALQELDFRDTDFFKEY